MNFNKFMLRISQLQIPNKEKLLIALQQYVAQYL